MYYMWQIYHKQKKDKNHGSQISSRGNMIFRFRYLSKLSNRILSHLLFKSIYWMTIHYCPNKNIKTCKSNNTLILRKEEIFLDSWYCWKISLVCLVLQNNFIKVYKPPLPPPRHTHTKQAQKDKENYICLTETSDESFWLCRFGCQCTIGMKYSRWGHN